MASTPTHSGNILGFNGQGSISFLSVGGVLTMLSAAFDHPIQYLYIQPVNYVVQVNR